MTVRVAQIVGKMAGGGIESVVMNYYRHINRNEIQFDFIVDSDSTLVPIDEIEQLGGSVIEVVPYQHQPANSKEIERVLKGGRWPIVHSHLNALSPFALHAAKKAGVPIRIAHSHATWGKGEFKRNVLKALLRTQANRYPTHRMASSRHAGEWLFGKRASFDVLYNAIEIDRFSYDERVRNRMRDELGIKDGQLAIGHVGRFVVTKNQGFLLEVFREVLKRGIDSKLILVGDGLLRPKIEERVHEMGLDDRVLIVGQRDDVDSYYQALDVFVLPSLYEGLGMVAVEAQCSGLPCILSDRVPAETDLKGDATYLSLDVPSDWVDAICSIEPGQRIESGPDSFSRYNIVQEAPRLADYYLEALRAIGCHD